MKRITVFALAVLCCTVSHAGEFNVALGGSVSGEDFGDVFDANSYTLDARYYFHAISDSDGPYREAAFINPASSVAVSYSNADFDGLNNVSDSDDWQLQGRYFNRSHSWYVSAGVGKGESDTRVGPEVPVSALEIPLTPSIGGFAGVASLPLPIITSETDADSKYYSLRLGRYFGARTTLDFVYVRSETEADTRSISCFDGSPFNIFDDFLSTQRCFHEPFTARLNTEIDHWQVTAKHLGEVAHAPLALRGSIGYLKSSAETELSFQNRIAPVAIDPGSINLDLLADAVPFTGAVVLLPQPTSFTDEGWNTAVDITLYPRNRLGLTISYEYEDIESFQTKTYGAAVEWFITHSFAVSLSYTDIDLDNDLGRRDSVALQLSGRF